MNSNSHWHHYLIDFNNQKIIHHHTYNVRQDCTSNMELLQLSSQPNEDGYIQLPPPFLGDYRRGRRHAGQLSSQGQKILAHLEHRCAIAVATSPPAATIYQFLNCDFSDQNWHITCNDCSFVWPVTSLLRMELPSSIVAPHSKFACFWGRRHWDEQQTKTENTRRKKRRIDCRRAIRSPSGAGRSLMHFGFSAPMSIIMSDWHLNFFFFFFFLVLCLSK